MSLYTPPTLARSLAAITRGDDGWVPEGLHWHVDLSPALGLPLHPFLVWRWFAPEPSELRLQWTDSSGELQRPPFTLAHTGPLVADLPAAGGRPPQWVWVRLVLEDDNEGCLLEVLDQRVSPAGEDRVVAARSEYPFALGAPGITRLRVSGQARVLAIEAIDAERADLGWPNREDLRHVGLPAADLQWYVHGPSATSDDWRDRVYGSVLRLPPMDDPDEVAGLLDPGAEERRLDAVSQQPDRWLHDVLPWPSAGPPSEPSQHLTPPRPDHLDPRRVTYQPLHALVSAATADPGLARWLGTTARLAEQPPDSGPHLVLAASTWAVPMRRVAFEGLPGPRDDVTLEQLLAATNTPGTIKELVRHEIGGDAWECLEAVVGQLRDAQPDLGWEAVTLLLVTGVEGKAPVDLPPKPDLRTLRPGSWLPPMLGPDGRLTPRETWQQQISLRGGSPNGPVALVRREPGGPVPVHEQVDVGGDPPRRSLAMLAGYPSPATTSPDLAAAGLGGPGGRVVRVPKTYVGYSLPDVLTGRDPVVVDSAVPAEDGGATWSVAEGDWIGRWGPQAELHAPLPSRPRPPTPEVAGLLMRGPTPSDGSIASAGVIRIRVTVPAVRAPGGRPVKAVRLWLDGTSPLELPAPTAGADPLDPPPTLDYDVPAPGTLPGRGTEVRVWAVAIDDEDNESPAASVLVEARDARAAPVPKTSQRLVVAGRRDPEGLSQVALRWKIAPGAAGYRVYLGSQDLLLRDGLGLDAVAADALVRGPRAELADFVCDRESTLHDRRLFSLLTPEPLPVPGGASELTWLTVLPGGLTGVAFLRVVPVTGGGVEPPFAASGLTPVVVPLEDVPPAPALSARVAPDGRVRLRVVAGGIDTGTVARLGGGSPQARLLRRHRSLPSDPAYWPADDPVDLVLTGREWTAEIVVGGVGGLPAWTPMSWVAQVAYPAEPTLPAGASEVPADVRAEWLGPPFTSSPWGPVSVPAHAMLTPVLPAPTVAVEEAGDGTRRLLVGGVVPAPPGAPAPVRLRILADVGAGLVPVMADVAVTGAPTVVSGVTVAALYAIQTVDPIGRAGDPVLIEP